MCEIMCVSQMIIYILYRVGIELRKLSAYTLMILWPNCKSFSNKFCGQLFLLGSDRFHDSTKSLNFRDQACKLCFAKFSMQNRMFDGFSLFTASTNVVHATCYAMDVFQMDSQVICSKVLKIC